MNYGKVMEFVGFLLIVGTFLFGLYKDVFHDISISKTVGFDSLPYILGMFIWSLGYMINPDRHKNKEG